MILNKFANYLVSKGIFDKELVENASRKMFEYGESSAGALARILVSDFGAIHDSVYEALARHYAFPQFDVDMEQITAGQEGECKEILSKIPEELKTKLLYPKIFPFAMLNTGREALQVLASDPTDKMIQEIIEHTQYKRLEIYWSHLKTIEDLIAKLAPQKNEFLQLLEEAGQVLTDIDDGSSGLELNEAALDEEINKSLLVNLFEGALLEAVTKDASDIHIIPGNRSTIDIYFRIDGKLQLWHRQEERHRKPYRQL
jgi:type IV pilus assembly protein PilB